MWKASAAIAAVAAAAAYFWLLHVREGRVPPHLLHHPAIAVPGLLSEEDAGALRALAREMATFPTNAQDVRFYKTLHEDIGEAVPLSDAEKGCKHRYLVPNNNRTHCVLPGRVDIGRHFILTGGLLGLKEFHEKLVSRVLSFGRYIFDPNDYPVIKGLFARESFLAAARGVCPPDQQVLDPFQFNLIVQVPGQTVPLHLDAPYFSGASRFEFPQWLLAAMVFSDLFADRFINQVQVVAYFHEWDNAEERGGNFAYFPEGSTNPKRLLAHARAGSAIDGSKSVHAADVYLPKQAPPLIDKSKATALESEGNGSWVIRSDSDVLRRYADDDLRWTVVYRARCFADEDARQRYHNSTERLTLDEILSVFAADLAKRGAAPSAAEAMKMDRLDFALLLLDTYVKYPFSDAMMPFNYCALSKLWPPAAHVLKHFCN